MKKKRKDKGKQIILFDESPDAVKERQEYETQLHKHRRRVRIGWVLGICVAVAAGVAYFVYDIGRTFHSYGVVWEVNLEGQSVEFEDWKGGVLEYSQNGASYINEKGTVVWSAAYHMSHPTVVTRGEYSLIVDQKGSELVICNRQLGVTGTGTTPTSITKGDISEGGVAAVICESDTVSNIYYYKSTGSRLDIGIKSPLERTGYPVDLAVSSDGKTLMVSYLYVDSGVMQNKVVFYNFGGDADEYLAGSFEYGATDTIVPIVKFFDATKAVAVGDNNVTFYQIHTVSQQKVPKKMVEYSLERTILSVFETEDCVGMILSADTDHPQNTVVLYNAEGEQQMSVDTDQEYTDVFYNGRFVVLYNQYECVIYDQKGAEKFHRPFANGIGKMVAGAKSRRFLLRTADYLQEISLK